jgi:putative ATPase
VALFGAKNAVERASSLEVPLHLRNAPVKAMRETHGYSQGYQYPHDAEGAVVKEDYFPIGWNGDRSFYEPSDRGFEAEVSERLQRYESSVTKLQK